MSSSYTFEAEPKVVKTHSKFRVEPLESRTNQDPTSTFNRLMADPKIKSMNPINQEQEYIRLEKERIKIDNMHSQLVNFKKNKKRMTPYDIKPSPNPRIDANLQFFLTDPNNQPAITKIIDTQTDGFEERPPSPIYIPKKTGIDACTQVEDNELFDFDREVTPLVNVITTKTLEQSLLELEEEDELENMKEYKKEYHQRKDEEKERMKSILIKEIEKVKQKNKMVDLYKEKQKLKNRVFYHIQAYNIGKQYLSKLKQNTLQTLLYNGFFPNYLQQELENSYTNWSIEQTFKELMKIEPIFGFDKKENGLLFDECVIKIQETRIPVDQRREKLLEKMRKRKFNILNKQKKIVKLFYRDMNIGTIPSFEARLFAKFIDGTMMEYENNKISRLTALQTQVDNNEITEEEFQNIKKTEFPEYPRNRFGFAMKYTKKIGFNLAHNMYYPSIEQNQFFQLHCYLFSETGDLLHHIEKSKENPIKYIKYKKGIRDKTLKTSDDETIEINFNKISDEVYSIMMLVELPDYAKVLQQQSDIEYSRFSLTDPEYNLLFDSSTILKDYKFEDISKDLDPNSEAGSSQTGVLIPYYISKRNNEWIIEFIKESKVYIGNELPKFYSELPNFIKNCNERNKEESSEKNYNLTTNRAFDNIIIDIKDDLNDIKSQLIAQVENESPEILLSADWGTEFFVNGKLFERPTQIRTIKKLGELELRKKKEPEMIKAPDDEDGGDGEEAKDQDNGDFHIDEV